MVSDAGQSEGKRRSFAHDAFVALEGDSDSNALGGAITAELCGQWDHPGPCPLAPHHTRAEPTAGGVRLRILFAAAPEDEPEVRARIKTALGRSSIEGPDGRWSRWVLQEDAPSQVYDDEAEHAARLSRS